MKIKVSDYIINFLEKNGINTVFTITGGFAMHLNDSFGMNKKFNIYYQHHEQACGYSAVGYSKTNSKPVIVCTTAGVAATNTISPCVVAHQDSIPVLFISGQVKSTESIHKINTPQMQLRHYAGADCDIISMVKPITKYAKEILDINELDEILKTTMYHLINGRPGPVWLSIPVDIQGMLINEIDIPIIQKDNVVISNEITNNLNNINKLLLSSKRPIIIAGNGIKLGNCIDKFRGFINKYNIPVVVTYNGTDLIENNHNLYSGRVGIIGDRSGNFSVQNSDLIISMGCRMAQGIIGYRADWFAREAKIIYIDNDSNELEKTNLNYTLKINMDLNTFFDNFKYEFINNFNEWVNKCNHWKQKWLFEIPHDEEYKKILTKTSDSLTINPYHALKLFFNHAPENKIILCSSGSIITNVWHMANIKKGDKFIISSQGDMGFELPASIGASIAEKEKMVVPIFGEGSFQLNIQELQTIVQYKLPIKIFLFNNAAYGAIQITQTNFFNNKFGVDTTSGISFPDTEKVAYAYGIKYIGVRNNNDLEDKIKEFIDCKETIIFEVFCCIQGRYPRLNAIKNEDGTFSNRPFEDMDPFIDRDELKNEMIVKMV
jgi:acetolactate synthase-1/2/3 large subunit